jgi:hypothetical protein
MLPPPFPPRLILLPPMRHTLPNIRFAVTRKLDTARAAPTPWSLNLCRAAPTRRRAVLGRKRRAGRKRIPSGFARRRRTGEAAAYLAV